MRPILPEALKQVIEFEKSQEMINIKADYERAMTSLDEKLTNQQITPEHWDRAAEYHLRTMQSRIHLLAQTYQPPYDNAA